MRLERVVAAARVECSREPAPALFLGFLFAVTAVVLSACGHDTEAVQVDSSAYRQDLESLSKARIFFGHQSVGRNLLEGLSEIAQQGKLPLRIIPIDGAHGDSLPGLFHAEIGKNLEPIGKIEAFTRLLQQSTKPAYDVALMKFCYVDLSRDGFQNPKALAEEYAKGVAAVRVAHPHLRLIHMTIPLTADPPGWKTTLKRLLHRDTEEDTDNQMRNAFNSEIRKRFAGDALFDLAEVESTLPDGRRSYFMRGRDTIYTLAQAYTTDGAHLNQSGRQHAAAALIRVVADTLRKDR